MLIAIFYSKTVDYGFSRDVWSLIEKIKCKLDKIREFFNKEVSNGICRWEINQFIFIIIKCSALPVEL